MPDEEESKGQEKNNFECSVTCFKCSQGLPIRAVDKSTKSEKTFDNTFMFSKHQTQFCKELIERGVFTVATHYCITCDNQKRADKKMQDIEKVCLLCAIKHKSDHLQHRMVQIASVQNI